MGGRDCRPTQVIKSPGVLQKNVYVLELNNEELGKSIVLGDLSSLASGADVNGAAAASAAKTSVPPVANGSDLFTFGKKTASPLVLEVFYLNLERFSLGNEQRTWWASARPKAARPRRRKRRRRAPSRWSTAPSTASSTRRPDSFTPNRPPTPLPVRLVSLSNPVTESLVPLDFVLESVPRCSQ